MAARGRGLFSLYIYIENFKKCSCQKPLDRFQYNFAEMFLWWSSTKIVQAIWIRINYKHFDENKFISDIANDLDEFAADKSSIDEDLNIWYSFLLKHLNNHAPIKSKRVKSKRMPDWFTPDIIQMQSLRDKTKRLKQWSDHRKYRNKTKQLIRQAKRKYFSNSITNSKDTKSLWKHLRDVTNGSKTASSNLPQKLIIGNETITESEAVASKLNKYFASVAELLNKNTSSGNSLDFDTNKISDFVDSKVPTNTQFTIPFITPEQVLLHINTLEVSKSTGLDGIGPRIIKLAAKSLSPSIIFLVYLYRKVLKVFFSETSRPISVSLGRNVSLVTLYQDFSSRYGLSKNMALGGGAYFPYISI